jgi:uncharacterized protein YndB with AHSA1/START domain
MTDLATTTETDPTDADYQASIAFTSPPSAVFEALTGLEGLVSWWTAVAGDGRASGELRFDFGQGSPCVMHVDEAQPSSVQWTCVGYPPLPDWTDTTIHFQLTERPDGGSDLAFRHRGLTPRLECFSDCKNGWDHFLPSLRDYVDTGTGRPWTTGVDGERRLARDPQPISSPAR